MAETVDIGTDRSALTFGDAQRQHGAGPCRAPGSRLRTPGFARVVLNDRA